MFTNSSFDFLVKKNTATHSAVTQIPPPSTFEEWLLQNNLEDWPLELDEEETNETELHLTPDVGLGTKADIYNEIKTRSCIFSSPS